MQADIKTIAALGGYGLNVLTSVVSEIPGRVSMMQRLSPALIADQMHVLFDGFPIGAAKTGMIGGIEQVQALVAAWITIDKPVPLVVDPVMIATSGARLLEDEAIEAVKTLLLPLARLITPNLDEAAVLWGRPVTTRAEMESCGQDLSSMYGCAVLVKGGHLAGDKAADALCHTGSVTWFEAPRVAGVHTHGTGCAYSAAIATGLARGMLLIEAVRAAKAFVARAIAQHHAWGDIHALNHLQQR
ncbi:MAG: phosphomethylpyrimidine kinase [Rhizorhabdus sp.]|nr:phosphomethylpyrimidine kinase [Rhizorhabdus sp.]